MEASLLNSFIAASRLRRWLSRSDAPVWVRECKAYFDQAFSSRFKDSRVLVDTPCSSIRQQPTPSDLQRLIKLPSIQLHAYATYADVTYARSSTHVGNSLIMYYPNGAVAQGPVAGSIKYIYSQASGIRFAVQRQLLPPVATPNPYRRYPHFPAQIFSTALSENLEEVKLTWILGHYARWAVSEDLCVGLMLQRVCP